MSKKERKTAKVKTLREAVKEVDRLIPGAVFKPGYPVARSVYMIADRPSAEARRELGRLGFKAFLCLGAGYDYNYGGCLYLLQRGA